jgi:acyl-coenzyme A thioesterase PaaI-like protein
MGHDPPIPAGFGEFFAPYPEHRLNAVGATFTQCFGCGPTHPTGLRVRAFVADGGVLSPIVVPAVYAGPPRAAHGGIVAAYLDEICGAAAMSRGQRIYVTGELSVRYLKPTPVETPLLGRGRVVQDHGRYVDVEASLEEFEEARTVATATARFVALR